VDFMAKATKKHVPTKRQKHTPSKKKKHRGVRSKKRGSLQRDIVVIFGVFVLFVGVLSAFYLGKYSSQTPLVRTTATSKGYTTQNLLDDLAKLKAKEPKESLALSSEIKVPKVVKSKREAKKPKKRDIEKKKRAKTSLVQEDRRAQLVIIIDDVHTRRELNAIWKLGFPVTPSIFPPYRQARHSEKLALGVSHYMVHLPMESGSQKFNRQTKTLMRSFSSEQIFHRIEEIRRLFPQAKYINNHTGSLFTSNTQAMFALLRACRVYGFRFVDSVTTGKSKVRYVAKQLHQPYVRRDIFLDNIRTTTAIHRQLKKAIRLAKKRGYAIAIGHPHRETLQALRLAKPLLKGLKVVYMDQLYIKGMR